MIVVSALLKIESVQGIRPGESLKIFQRTAGGVIDIPGINTRSKSFHKAAPVALWVEPALFCERFEQNQRAVTVMGLVPRFFSKVIMTFFWSFESVDTIRVKLLEFIEIVDPVGAQGRSVSDKLAPHGSSEPVFDGDILAYVNLYHVIEF